MISISTQTPWEWGYTFQDKYYNYTKTHYADWKITEHEIIIKSGLLQIEIDPAGQLQIYGLMLQSRL